MNQAVAAPQPHRVEVIDALRGLALLGVLLVNLLTEFRVSIFEQFLGGALPASDFDRFVSGVLSFGLQGKAICLFSLLFGVGLAMQFDRMAHTRRPHYWLGRRLLVLLGFGVIHLVFVRNGDILTAYAIVGLLALPFIGMSSRVLGVLAASAFALYAAMPFLPVPVSLPDHAELQAHVQAAYAINPSGGINQIWQFSVTELQLLLPLHVFILPRTLALFFLGAYLWRSGLLPWATKRSPALGAASAILVVAGMLMQLASPDGIGPILSQLAPVVLALGYAASVIFLSRYGAVARRLSVLGPVGRMAFTNYVSQSFIFCMLFYGYGLGLYGRCGVATALAVGLVVYAAQVIWSEWWLNRFRFGPLEWCWRSLTYGKSQPMRRTFGPERVDTGLERA